MTATRQLHGLSETSRRSPRWEHLRNYVLACLRANVVSWRDLLDPASLPTRLAKTLSADLVGAVADAGSGAVADEGAERRSSLRLYVAACVRESVLRREDLSAPDLVGKLAEALAADAREAAEDLGRSGAASLLGLAGAALSGLAGTVLRKTTTPPPKPRKPAGHDLARRRL